MSMKLVTLSNLSTFAGEIKNKYATKETVSGIDTRVTALENVGSQANVLEGVKVNGTALDIASKIVDILIAEGSTNGTVKVNNVDIAVHGLAALAYKAEVSKDELAAALKTEIEAKAEASDLTTLEGKVTTLIGSDASKSVRAIANEELAAQLIPESAKESLDTLAEIAAWIQEHPDDASAMNAAIEALEAICAGIGGEGDEHATVAAYVDAKVSAIGIGNYYTKTEVDTELDKKVDKADGKSLVSDTEIARLAAMSTGANKTEASDTNGNIKVDGVETTVYTLPDSVVHDTDIVAITETEIKALLVDTAE